MKDFSKNAVDDTYPLKRRVSGWQVTITFDHRIEAPSNLRQLKRAIGGKFDKSGNPPYLNLIHTRDIPIGSVFITTTTEGTGLEEATKKVSEDEAYLATKVVVENSFKCTTSCVPANSPMMEELAE